MIEGEEVLNESSESLENEGSLESANSAPFLDAWKVEQTEPEVLEEETEEQNEPVLENVEETESVVDKEPEFVLKVGNKWFKSWSPYALSAKKSEAKVLNADWARQYKSDIKMMKRIVAEVVQL